MAQAYTLLPKLRTDRTGANGSHQLVIVVTIQRTRHLVGVGRTLLPTEWDDIKKKAKGPRAAALNTIVARKHAELTAILEEVDRKTTGLLTMADFKAAIITKPFQQIKIADYLAQEMLGDKAFQAKRTPSTLKRINEAFQRIIKVLPAEATFDSLKTENLVAAFDTMLRAGLRTNTALKSITVLRQVYNHAHERGITKAYPFTGYRTPAYQKVPKPYLTLQNCDRLLTKLEASESPEEPMTTLSFFLLECFSGLRQSDWNTWQIDKGEEGKTYLRLRMSQKTGEPVRLPLHNSPRLERIVQWIAANFSDRKYPYTQQHANRTLAKLMESMKLDATIRTHSGRHTCATLLLDRGFSREAVAEVLGVTVRIVDTYAKMTRQKVQLEYEKLGGL